jgi:hypothetical protein
MYMASLYGRLGPLVKAKRISMLAHGGGCVGLFRTLHVKGDLSEMCKKFDHLPRLAALKCRPVPVEALSVGSVSCPPATTYAYKLQLR